MPGKWLEALKEEENKHNTAAALRVEQNPHVVGPAIKPKTPVKSPSKTSKTPSEDSFLPESAQNPPSKTSKTLSTLYAPREDLRSRFEESLRHAKNPTVKTSKTSTEAEALGLVATWSVDFGFVSMHDPTSGEWHDLPTKEAPEWAAREARKRKELYRDGNRKAFRLTSREIGKILEAVRPVEEEGIVEEHPVEEE